MAMMQLPAFQPPQLESPGTMMTRMAQMQAMQDASEEKRYLIEQRAAAQQWRQGLNTLVEESGGEMTPKLLAHFVRAPDPAMQKFGLEGLAELKATNAYAQSMKPPEQPPLFEGRAPTQNFLGIKQGFDIPERQPLSVGNELAPTRAASAFRPVSLDDRIARMEDMRDRMIAFSNMYPKSATGKNALEQAKLIDGQINSIRTSERPLVVGAGAALATRTGQSLFSQPPLPVTPAVVQLPGVGGKGGVTAVIQASRTGETPTVNYLPYPKDVGPRVAANTVKVQDPLEPSRELVVDTNVYQPGTGVGAPGVIGIVGETAAQKKAREKQETKESEQKTAMETLAGELNNQRFYYQQLDKLGGITSTQRSGLENLSASAASSGLGQALGRTFGTEEQAYRDSIKSSKLRLLMAIAKVTGQKSGQLNSNVELQTWLDGLSDPKQGIQAAEENIANIEAFVQRSLSRPVTQEPKPTPTPSKGLGRPAPKRSLEDIMSGKR
jgi:hypothetical protein